jgi:transposase InsO family protein
MIRFFLECGYHLTIAAFYVPDFSVCLLSVDRLNFTGYTIVFRQTGCTIIGLNSFDKSEALSFGARPPGRRGCRLLGHPTTSNIDPTTAYAAEISRYVPTLQTWHQRLGHLNYADVRSTLSSEQYSGTVPIEPCTVCLTAKAKESFQRQTPSTRASKPLELIHSDVCGPISPCSLSGFRYYIIYVDDYSRYTWIYFLRTKSTAEIVSVFVEFKNKIELEFHHNGFKITRFRCDNGKGEYDNKQFRQLLTDFGIAFEPSPPYTQHKNGVSERMLQTHNGKGRAMMVESKLPGTLWAEAINTANYLHARTPTSANAAISPFEKLYGRKPEVSHLRRFGCIAYRLIPSSQRTGKFSARAEPLIFVGYVSKTIWRLWNPSTNRIILASNVTFDESNIYVSKDENGGSTVTGLEDLPELVEVPIVTPGEVSSTLQSSSSDANDRASNRRSKSFSFRVDASTRRVSGALDTEGIDSDGSSALSTNSTAGLNKPFSDEENMIDTNAQRFGMKRYDLRQSRPRISAHQVRVEELPEADPVSYREAISYPIRSEQWMHAVCDEFNSMKENNTWEYVAIEDVPANAKAIESKWVFKTKTLIDNGVRYKARLVIRGDRQSEGIDFDETFAPVAKLVSLRMLLSLAALQDWELDQMDVVTAFLNPEIDGDVYMKLPEGIHSWSSEIPSNSVCKLRKALYGLKQAPRLWYKHIDAFLCSIDLQRCQYDPNVYISSDSLATVIILLYVDDLLLFSESRERIDHFKQLLKERFRMTDLGPAQQFLGLSIVRDRTKRILFLHQQAYIETLLTKYGLSNCNGHWTPMTSGSKLRKIESTEENSEKLAPDEHRKYQSIVGSLMWLMLGTRPDLAYTVSVLSKFNAAPSSEHLSAATYCLRYLRNTSSYGIQYDRDASDTLEPIGFTDSDFAGDVDDRKSTSGYVFLLGGGAVSWRSRKQPLVAFSTVEAEYIGTSDAAKEAIWIRNLFASLHKKEIKSETDDPNELATEKGDSIIPQQIFVDNQGAMQLAKDPKFHERTKHISVRYHFVRDACEREIIRLSYLPTSDMVADILTKALPREVHWKHMHGLGLLQWDAVAVEEPEKRRKDDHSHV